MTRTQAIAVINSQLDVLTDERVEALAALAQAWSEPTAYSTLSDIEKADVESALDRLDRGLGIPWDEAKSRFRARLSVAGT